MRIRIILLLVSCSFLLSSSYSQTANDSAKKSTFVIQEGLALGMTRVNTNYTFFYNNDNYFYLKKAHYMFSSGAYIYMGWKIKQKFPIKTGIIFNSKSTLLTDSYFNELKLSEAYINIPLMTGRTTTLKNHNSLELLIGVYGGTIVMDKLDFKVNLDASPKYNSFGKSIRYGGIIDLGYCFNYKNNSCLKIGYVSNTDFNNIQIGSGTDNAIFPLYYSTELYFAFKFW